MRPLTIIELNRYFSCEIEVKNKFVGGNSVVHQVQAGPLSLAVKEYTGESQRILRSLQREASALNFLQQHHIPCVPKMLYSNEDLGFIVMEFITGERPISNRDSIVAMLKFIEILKDLYQVDPSFAYAIDAGTSDDEIRNQIRGRLSEVGAESIELVTKIKNLIKEKRGTSIQEVLTSDLTYSVSDLGVHNSLSRQGDFYYFDLEFFGKDSPYKLVGDFLLHPQNDFSYGDNSLFLEKSMLIFGLYEERLGRFVSLLSAKWTLICSKRLKKMIETNVDNEALQAQRDLVGYYLRMAEVFAHSNEWKILFDKVRFSL